MGAVVHDQVHGAVRVTLPGGLWRGAETEPLREVALRPVCGPDETSVLDRAGQALPCERATALLANCLVCEGLSGAEAARGLTVGDREALLLHLRRITLGDEIDCTLGCPSCGEVMELALRASELLLPPYQDVRRSYELSVEGQGGRFDIAFRLPTAGDLDHATAIARGDPGGGVLALLRRCVLHARGADGALPIELLPNDVHRAVAAAMAEHDPQAELELDLRCPACDAAFAVVFDTATFFLRELEARAERLLRDVHILALNYHWSESDILRMPANRRMQYLDLLAGARARRRGHDE